MSLHDTNKCFTQPVFPTITASSPRNPDTNIKTRIDGFLSQKQNAH